MLDAANYPGGNPTATVSGGRFTSEHGDCVASYATTGQTAASAFVSGGLFSQAVPEGFCATGYIPAANTDVETMSAYPYTVVGGYKVTFVNYDNSVLFTTNVVVGGTAVYEGATPTKPADANGSYTFSGWDPAVTAVTDRQGTL